MKCRNRTSPYDHLVAFRTASILASASPIRAALLEAAQIAFDIVPASVDEDAIKQAALQEGFLYDELVVLLAELKAEAVSQNQSGYVLGCDQILVCEDRLFSKPRTLDEVKITSAPVTGPERIS